MPSRFLAFRLAARRPPRVALRFSLAVLVICWVFIEIRSRHVSEQIGIVYFGHGPSMMSQQEYGLAIRRGTIGLSFHESRATAAESVSSMAWWQHEGERDLHTWHNVNPVDTPTGPSDDPPFQFIHNGYSEIPTGKDAYPGMVSYEIDFPATMVLAPAIIWFSWQGIWWVKRRRTRSLIVAGRCQACGYDVRFSTGRCPECGQPIQSPAT